MTAGVAVTGVVVTALGAVAAVAGAPVAPQFAHVGRVARWADLYATSMDSECPCGGLRSVHRRPHLNGGNKVRSRFLERVPARPRRLSDARGRSSVFAGRVWVISEVAGFETVCLQWANESWRTVRQVGSDGHSK